MKRLIEMYEQLARLKGEDLKLVNKYKELIDYDFMSNDIKFADEKLRRRCQAHPAVGSRPAEFFEN